MGVGRRLSYDVVTSKTRRGYDVDLPPELGLLPEPFMSEAVLKQSPSGNLDFLKFFRRALFCGLKERTVEQRLRST